MIVYGIKNCNTVKNALQWLNGHGVEYTFHDYKSKGVSDKMLESWCGQGGWEQLVNKRGTTWRQLDPGVQESITNEKAAIELMKEKPSVIKRPLLEKDGKIITLGFDEEKFSSVFKSR
jgi:arsenate reductase (glutaredoxin)